MLPLETVAARWKRLCEAAKIDGHPTVWVGHYDGDGQELGWLKATDPNSAGNAVLFLAHPYAVSNEVAECAIVVDVNQALNITQLWEGVTENGVKVQRTVDWCLRYKLDDRGKVRFAPAYKRPSAVWSDVHLIYTQRRDLPQLRTFADAFYTAHKLGEQMLYETP